MSKDRLDIVIPTIPGREESLLRCVESYEKNTIGAAPNFIIIRNSPASGVGWLRGMETSDAPYVHLTNDDIQCDSPLWFEACRQVTEYGHFPAPEVLNSDGSVQSRGGALGAPANLMTEPKEDYQDVDFTTVPFMTREQWDRIGMIPVHYCSDVWVSYRGRQLGIKTVFHRFYRLIHHNHQVGRGAGMPQHERDAMDRVTMFNELAKHHG